MTWRHDSHQVIAGVADTALEPQEFLKQIRRGTSWEIASKAVYPEGSYGNGAAMRSAVLALFFANDEKRMLQSVRETSVVTHSHPIGIDAANDDFSRNFLSSSSHEPRELYARLIANASTSEIRDRLVLAASWYDSNACPTAREVVSRLGMEFPHKHPVPQRYILPFGISTNHSKA